MGIAGSSVDSALSPAHPPARARKVPRIVREAVNRRAHAAGAAYATQWRDRMMAEVADRLAAGERLDAVLQALRGD